MLVNEKCVLPPMQYKYYDYLFLYYIYINIILYNINSRFFVAIAVFV